MSDLPIPFRIIMRRAQGRTMIGGVLLSDICADGHERMWSGELVLMPTQRVRVITADHFGGKRIDEMMVGHLGSDPHPQIWEEEK